MLSSSNEEMKRTSIQEIRRLIQSLKTKKSAGFDQISNFMIKRLSPSYIECLAKCFNQWLNEWKLAKVVTQNK